MNTAKVFEEIGITPEEIRKVIDVLNKIKENGADVINKVKLIETIAQLVDTDKELSAMANLAGLTSSSEKLSENIRRIKEECEMFDSIIAKLKPLIGE